MLLISRQSKRFLYYTKNSKIFFKRVETQDNHYDILGVSHDSDYEKIKESYYILAKKFHPDLNKDPKALVIITRNLGKI